MDAAITPALRELVPLVVGSCSRSVAGFDAAVEDALSKSDEAAAALEAIRAELGGPLEAAFASLREGTAELNALYAFIEAAEGAVGRVHAAARAANERLAVLQKAYDAKYPEAPSLGSALSSAARSASATLAALTAGLGSRPTVATSAVGSATGQGGEASGDAALTSPPLSSVSAKLGGLFSFGSGKSGSGAKSSSSAAAAPSVPAAGKRGPIDAPVQLPAWDSSLASISAAAEVAALSAHVGDVEALLRAAADAAQLEAELKATAADAALARAEAGASADAEGDGDDDDDAGDDDDDDDDGVDDSRPKQGARGGTRDGAVSPLAAGAGEDEEEEEEEEEDEGNDDDDGGTGGKALPASSPAASSQVAARLAGGEDDEEEGDD